DPMRGKYGPIVRSPRSWFARQDLLRALRDLLKRIEVFDVQLERVCALKELRVGRHMAVPTHRPEWDSSFHQGLAVRWAYEDARQMMRTPPVRFAVLTKVLCGACP